MYFILISSNISILEILFLNFSFILFNILSSKTLPKDKIIIINLSGRGDKDVNQIMKISEGQSQML